MVENLIGHERHLASAIAPCATLAPAGFGGYMNSTSASVTPVSTHTTVAMSPAAPVEVAQRITSLDVLRGFALLGILAMNIQAFSMIGAAYSNPSAYGDLTGANLWVWFLVHLLADQKMYGIFSMLFGAGIVLMMGRAEARGAGAGLHYRRMGWLVLFGLLHAHLLWFGDILYTYALCGMVVYLLHRKSPSTLLVLSIVFFAVGSLIPCLGGWSMQFWPPDRITLFTREKWLPTAEMVQRELAAYRGGWLTQMPYRIKNALFFETLLILLGSGWKSIGNMLLGMALFKVGILTAQRSRGMYAGLAVAGFLAGLPMVGFGVWRNFVASWNVRYSFFFGSQYNYWGAIIVDIGWIGALMLLCTSPRLPHVKAALSAVGRMAFSNYILQTLICTTLFYGHGFGLFGSVNRVGQILIVMAIWAAQLVISPLWLRHFTFGPLEWLWRSLTYWRRMPLRNTKLLLGQSP
jgi:uncharacterized protein